MTTTASRPLVGCHIAITRPPEQAGALARALEALGARVTTLPAITIAPAVETTALDAALGELATYDWVVFTSVNGVQAFDERLVACGLGWEARGRARVAAIGPATARALAARGAAADVVPAEYVAEALAEALGNVAGQRILLPRADIARETLARELTVRGAEVNEIAAYRTITRPIPPELLARVAGEERADAITFTSSSTVRGLLESLAAAGRAPEVALGGIALAAIGPITAATLREHGLEPAIVAEEYTVSGLVRALVEHFTGTAQKGPPHE
ncbi:MAG: uroporphyrinogen-III synthase [Ktedonobacterales bacterium]|nr:uroporphyrinogen-III synthase [Ktedonobacterales bacterium]